MRTAEDRAGPARTRIRLGRQQEATDAIFDDAPWRIAAREEVSMTPEETLVLTRYVKACCPQQAIDKYTPDAWHDLLGDLSLEDCRAAVVTVAKRQPFVAPAEIRAEVRRIRDERLDAGEKFLDPPSGLDGPAYQQWLINARRRIADGTDRPRALEVS